ncbi:MAG TPA: alkaline phosphatase family protein [Acidimicrobiales bacterium]|nr:alkaline phosphatase family protein [Acidimicrobiales bacterium]
MPHRLFRLCALLLLVAAGCHSAVKTTQATSTSTTLSTSTSTSTSTVGPATSTTIATTLPTKTTATTLAPAGAAPCGWAPSPPATYQHVIWIWMENHTWPQVLGDARAAPYEVALAGRCGTATNYRSVGSPSLPNYIGATSGSAQGIGDDADPASHPLAVDNLFRQVRTAGGTERSYQEAMSPPCQQSSGGEYAVKHNPAAYYVGGQDRAACQADDVPLTQLAPDLASGRLPTFAFITPNLCHDTHDCSVATGDAWLSGFLPSLLTSATYRAGATAIILVWDEESPMPNVMIGPAVHPGTVSSARFDHFALLRTTEEMLGLPGRLGSAAAAPSLRAPFNL